MNPPPVHQAFERKNVFAFTDTQWPTPAYVSINTEDDNVVSVTVRTMGVEKPAVIFLNHQTLSDLSDAIADFMMTQSKSCQG